jgi:hypothetical protein
MAVARHYNFFDGYTEPSELVPILAQHGPHLRSFYAHAYDMAEIPWHLCTALEHFECDGLPHIPNLALVSRTITTIAAICGRDHPELNAEPLASALLAFPLLKTFALADCPKDGDLYRLLKSGCAERGIAFEAHDTIPLVRYLAIILSSRLSSGPAID